MAALIALVAGGLDPVTSVALSTGTVGSAPRTTTAVVPGTYAAVTPYRALDTRSRIGVPGTTPVGAGATVTVAVARPGGVPSSGVAAVMATVTVVGGAAPGYLTSWASGTPRPVVSTLNWTDGRPVTNSAVVPVGTDGRLAFYNGSGKPVHVVVDLEGWYAAGSVSAPGALRPVTPHRVLDTRHAIGTPNYTPVDAGGVGVQFPVAPVASGAAVWLNVTATAGVGSGWVSVGASVPGDLGGAQPTPTSVLSWSSGRTSSDLVLARVGRDGTVFLQAGGSGAVHLVADVLGVVLPGALSTTGTTRTASMVRQLDTRSGTGPIAPGATLAVPLTVGPLSAPAGDITAAVVTVTVAAPAAAGYLTSPPAAGSGGPDTSLVTWASGQTVSVTTALPVDGQGRVLLRNASPTATHLVVDLAGVVLARDVPTAAGWTAQRVALGTGADDQPWATSLGCGARGACAAALVISNTPERRYVALRADDGRWGSPLLVSAGIDRGGLRVAPVTRCSATGLCIATFVAGNGAGSVATSSPTAGWQVRDVPGSAPATTPRIVAAGCSRTGNGCMVLTNESVGGGYRAAVSTWNGVGWTAVQLPTGSSSASYVGADVDCRTDDDCVVVGRTGQGPVVSRWDGSTWTTGLVPAGLEVTSVGYVRMLGDRVVAFGGLASGAGALLQVGAADGTGWSALDLTHTGGLGLPECPISTPSTCYAVTGSGTDLAGHAHGPGVASLVDLATTEPTAPALAQPQLPLLSLACGDTRCVASGNDVPRLVARRSVVVEQSADAWVTGLLPLPTDAAETEVGTSPGPVGCWDTGCLALTTYIDTHGVVALAGVVRRGP